MRFLFLAPLLTSLLLGACADEAALQARTEKLAAFSIDLPDGWKTNIPQGQQCLKGHCAVGFSLAALGTPALTVSVMPSLDRNLQQLADETSAKFTQHEAAMEQIVKSSNRIEYKGTIKGSPAHLIAVLDEEHKEVGILLLAGEEKGLEPIVKTLHMANPRLDFNAKAEPTAPITTSEPPSPKK